MENVRKVINPVSSKSHAFFNLSLDFACLRNILRVLIYLVTTNANSSLDIQKTPAKIKTD